MAVPQVAAFWSYAHEDDTLDRGGIVELAESLRNEFALVTGEDLVLFVDRTGVSWGDEWRRRIDGALAETTFFVPIITPRYFTRFECRRELLDFSTHAKSLGTDELILPIWYAKVNDFTEQNPDEAVALVARMQHIDWTKLRLAGASSSEYRAAVNSLATRLAEVASAIAETQLSEELQDAKNPEASELGLVELFDRINDILPVWTDALEASDVVQAQFIATWTVYSDRITKAERSSPPSAQFALLQRLAIDELPLAEKTLKISQEFAAKTIELDPLVLAAVRIGGVHLSDRAIFTDLNSAISRARGNISNNEALSKIPAIISAADWAQKRAHISRAMNRLAQTWRLVDRAKGEANRIIIRWSEELKFLETST